MRSPRAKALHEVALKQAGYFTTQQAKAAGFKESTHPYHVHRGNWIRIHRGLYRLAIFPESRKGELIGWHLWSRDRKQMPEGVFSHLTALEVHGLFPPRERRVFITVPPSFRRTSQTPTMVRLYKSSLTSGEIVQVEAIPVTTMRRTLQDIAECDLLPKEELMDIAKRAAELSLIEAQFLTELMGDQFQLRFRK